MKPPFSLVSKRRRRTYRRTYRWDSKRTINKYEPQRTGGRIQIGNRVMMECRQHGLVHDYKRGCPKCSRRYFKLTKPTVLAGKRKKRDRRAPPLRK